MATIQDSRPGSTGITIPAGYLEDVRSALVTEIHFCGEALRTDQESLVSGSSSAVEDRACAMRLLRSDMQLLDQLLEASGDAKVTADPDTITQALQSMVRLLSARLAAKVDYSPIEMGAVLVLAGRLRWAAEEALRIEPDLDDRKVA
jgi:hypothetical protein